MTYSELAKVLAQALKDGLYERDDLYLFDTKLAWQLTNEAHVRKPQRLAVFAALEAHPDVAHVLGLHLNSGLNGARLAREALGAWLLTRATQLGPTAAIAELRSFLTGGHCELEEYLAFSGLEVSVPMTLPAGFELVPMTEIPESVLTISLTDPDWLYYGRNAKGYVRRKTVQVLAGFGKNILHSNPHVAMAALRIRYKRSPALLSTPVDFPNSVERMLDTLRVLAAVTCASIFPVAHWISAVPTTPLWNNFAWSYWYHLNALRQFSTVEGNEDRIARTTTRWEALADQTKQKLRIPLERLNRALAAPLAADCAIDLGLALEALLLADLSPNDQISLAFRLRGAWLLGATPAERRALAQQFNAIYTCRSSVVHRGTLPSDKFQVDGEKLTAEDFISHRACSLATSAVLKIIERGDFPDWGALVVGAE